jgi:hypothetical protein
VPPIRPANAAAKASDCTEFFMEYAFHWLSRARSVGHWMLAAPSAAGLEGIFRRTAATGAASRFSSPSSGTAHWNADG